jgi:hypothetical protein
MIFIFSLVMLVFLLDIVIVVNWLAREGFEDLIGFLRAGGRDDEFAVSFGTRWDLEPSSSSSSSSSR